MAMSVAALSTTFAAASFVALMFGLASVVAAARRPARLADLPMRALLGVVWLVPTVATAGSLYYSERAGFPPCELCWYQRIAMYPLVVVLGVATLQRRVSTALVALPLAAIGLVIAARHYWLQFAATQEVSCDITAPCDVRWVEEFGFVSIPFMAGCGFVAVLGGVLLAVRMERSAELG